MQNAHLRLGQLEYLRSTTTIQTRVRLHVDRFVGNMNKDTCSASMEEMQRWARLRPLLTRGTRFL